MIRLTRAQVQPIGLHLGQDCIRMMQLEVVEKSVSVLAAAKVAMPEDAQDQPDLALPLAMDAVKQMLRKGEFSGRKVVACVPRELIHGKNLRLPMMPPAEIESAVQFEAKNIFPFDTDHSVIRYLPAGEVRQGNDSRLEVIALAVQQQELDGFIEQLHRCGCAIESLDFEPSALYRGIERYIRRREDENEVHVLAEIGVDTTQVIIGKGRDISFYKPVDVGSRKLDDDVSRKLGITMAEAVALRHRMVDSVATTDTSDSVRQAVHDAIRSTVEELAREISLCLRYYSVTFRGQRPGKIRLLGAQAADAQILSILGSAFPIPVETYRPLYSVDTSRMSALDRRGSMSEWATAFGLGLKFTKGYFGARDGKQRSTSGADAPAGVEVVDLSKAVQAEATHA